MSGDADEDALVVGGGPCGLALAIGLRRFGLAVTVVEREAETVDDWSKAYSYRLDCRGLGLLRRLGLLQEVERRGVRSVGFSRTTWTPDGAVETKPGLTLGSVGYWLQRPHLVQLLRDQAAAEGVKLLIGAVTEVCIGECDHEISVECGGGGGGRRLRSRLLFGCDGAKSAVRQALEELDPAFGTTSISTPSAGLVFRAMLCSNPAHVVEPEQGIAVADGRGDTLSMLPFSGGQAPRPLGCVRPPSYWLYRLDSVDEVYAQLDARFPQLQARSRVDSSSVQAWIANPGSTFPRPRWAGRAALVPPTGDAAAAILGDALHAFPPDLGQGVNAALLDVATLLDALAAETDALAADHGTAPGASKAAAARALAGWGPERAREAEAICRLLPVGFPYQYNLPHSAAKAAFYVGFTTRLGLWKLLEKVHKATGLANPLHAPVVVLIQQEPPLAYSRILAAHRHNSRALAALGLAAAAMALRLLAKKWI